MSFDALVREQSAAAAETSPSTALREALLQQGILAYDTGLIGCLPVRAPRVTDPELVHA